jgi:hypothetical protein
MAIPIPPPLFKYFGHKDEERTWKNEMADRGQPPLPESVWDGRLVQLEFESKLLIQVPNN